MTNRSGTTTLAAEILDRAWEAHRKYEEKVNAWYTHGLGLPVAEGGKGWTFPRCAHGVNRWADYDCGPCRDGHDGWDWHREARKAIADAKWRLQVYSERADWLFSRPEDMPEELVETLRRWVVAPLEVRA